MVNTMVIIWLMMVNSNDWLVDDLPLWKIWLCQLGSLFPIYLPNMMGKMKFMFQTTNQCETESNNTSVAFIRTSWKKAASIQARSRQLQFPIPSAETKTLNIICACTNLCNIWYMYIYIFIFINLWSLIVIINELINGFILFIATTLYCLLLVNVFLYTEQ